MESQTHAPVRIQTSPGSVPATPSWLGEVAVIAQYLRHVGVLATIEERVRFARRRFGHYDLIDFAVVLIGYAISGECTLEAFYEHLHPFAAPFMALFGRERLPHRSTLSRFLTALNQTAVEALRTVFLEDLVARPLEKQVQPGGSWDRQGTHWQVFDVDGTRQAARQRALPCTPDLQPAQRRLDEVCAPGYTGRKRGEVVRTRTAVLQAHTHQWVGTFSGASGAGNSDYRGELRQAVKALRTAVSEADPDAAATMCLVYNFSVWQHLKNEDPCIQYLVGSSFLGVDTLNKLCGKVLGRIKFSADVIPRGILQPTMQWLTDVTLDYSSMPVFENLLPKVKQNIQAGRGGSWVYVALSVAGLVALVLTGALRGNLVFGHGVGVSHELHMRGRRYSQERKPETMLSLRN